MFGGIIDLTKESDSIYVFHIATQIWKLISYEEGPQNIEDLFKDATEEFKQQLGK